LDNLVFLGDFQKYIEYLPMIAAGFISTFLLTPVVGRAAKKFGIMHKPPSAKDKKDPEGHRRLEKAPRPILGGVAVVIPFLILSLFFQTLTAPAIGLLVGVLMLFVLGILDDKYYLSWKVQIIIQLIAIAVTIILGVGISSINNPFDGLLNLNIWEIPLSLGSYKFQFEVFGHLVYIFWVVLCINAVKWSSGTDGLMEGIVAIALLTFFLISVRSFDSQSAVFSAILLGCVVAFLFYNFYPSKILSGSSGKSVYGFVLAVLAVLSGAKFLLGLIILALPIVDMLWVMLKRARKSTEKSLLGKISAMNKGDNNHFHHQLLKLGLSEREVALVEYLITAFLGVIAFLMTGSLRTVLVLGGLILVGAIVIAISFLNSRKDRALLKKAEK
jgi:UDP-GlcNAc:undecaprenyl-phosphate/decaprenyl-phosphate GlcNAc-1-phosphate transferase